MLAFLTPDLSLTTNPPDCRVIQVPGDLWYLVSGALEALALPYNWEQFGTATPDEMADYFREVIEEYVMSSCAYLGEIRAFIDTTLPDGWLPFDNNLRAMADFPALAAIMPSVWIVPPGTNFRLPSLVGYGLAGQGNAGGFSAGPGARVGTLTHTLNESQIPSHNHTYVPPVLNIDLEGPGVPDILAAGIGTPTTTGNTGGGQSHNNLGPVMGVTWGIYAGQ